MIINNSIHDVVIMKVGYEGMVIHIISCITVHKSNAQGRNESD